MGRRNRLIINQYLVRSAMHHDDERHRAQWIARYDEMVCTGAHVPISRPRSWAKQLTYCRPVHTHALDRTYRYGRWTRAFVVVRRCKHLYCMHAGVTCEYQYAYLGQDHARLATSCMRAIKASCMSTCTCACGCETGFKDVHAFQYTRPANIFSRWVFYSEWHVCPPAASRGRSAPTHGRRSHRCRVSAIYRSCFRRKRSPLLMGDFVPDAICPAAVAVQNSRVAC